jgi:hypothetical protein
VSEPRGSLGPPTAPEVRFADPEPHGLAELLGGLIRQNLARDPARARLLRPALVAIEATDAEVAVTIRIEPGLVVLAEGQATRPHLAIRGPSAELLALTSAPLLGGYPHPLHLDGRRALRDVLTGRVRVRGLASHPRRLARLTMLLSAHR